MSTQAEYLSLLRKNHICWVCKKQDAWTWGGHAMCYDCWEKKRKYDEEYRKRPGYSEKMKEYQKERKNRLRKEHRCIKCGRPLDKDDFHKQCGTCRAKFREKYRQTKQESL